MKIAQGRARQSRYLLSLRLRFVSPDGLAITIPRYVISEATLACLLSFEELSPKLGVLSEISVISFDCYVLVGPFTKVANVKRVLYFRWLEVETQ